MRTARHYLYLALIVPLGFAFKLYGGPGHVWFNDYGAAVLYEVFWCLLAGLVFDPRKHALRIAVVVFVITCALEFLQLVDTPLLSAIRRYRLGQYLIGTTFVWWDFPHYVLGCVLGWWAVDGLDSG